MPLRIRGCPQPENDSATGASSAPQRASLSFAISFAAVAYIGAGLLLAVASLITAPRDTRRLAADLREDAEVKDAGILSP